MVSRDKLKVYLHDFLSCDNFSDYAPNGLQVEGQSRIRTICSAVTASLQVIEQSIILKADALLVHHGYFWKGEKEIITGIKQQRLAKLLQHDISLFAYHLPLDCHRELGNNACLAQICELTAIKTHTIGKTVNLLWSGEFNKSKTPQALALHLEKKLGQTPLHIEGSKKTIKRVAWCSGAAQDLIEDAAALGVDAYFSGEIAERTYYQAKELDVHYFACGHHATERYGIQALGNHLAFHFQIHHHFIDSANPI